MALIRARSRTRSASPVAAHHTGIQLPPRGNNADHFFRELETRSGAQKHELSEESKNLYREMLSGGTHSYSDRTCTIFNDEEDESVIVGVKTSTTVQEILDLLGAMLQCDPNWFTIKRRTPNGAKRMTYCEEVASQIICGGLKSFKRQQHRYEHPLLVLGGGLGGIQTCIDLQNRGQKDIICMEKHSDFSGHSWLVVANKFTKLQTEKGTYHVSYTDPTATVPKTILGLDYKTWPTRDQLIRMLQEGARENGLYEKAMLSTEMRSIKKKAHEQYIIQYTPTKEADGDGGMVIVSALLAWPGNLVKPNMIEFPGEDDFSGYIETCSFDKVDYTQCTKKNCIIYGHGAFTIENVRTVVEHHCKKVFVVCRKRNLCGMKMVSWMVGQSEFPIPGTVMLDGFQMMYNLVGFDVWQAFSVQTDKTRSFAQISQKTVFGVTDIYFLAGYYGLMEVVVDEIKRLTHHCAHTKKMRKLEVDVILKAIGTAPSFKVDKYLGLKELVGIWANGDPLRPISCNGMFVQARNFGSFSSGPGFAPTVKMMGWFIDYPEDWLAVEQKLPRRKADDRPAYVPDAPYFLPMHMAINSTLPMLAQQTQLMDSLKSRKQREAHPLEEYLPQCVREWEAYIREFKAHGMIDDRPDPPYPYTFENVQYMLDQSGLIASGQGKHEFIEAKLYYQPGTEPPTKAAALKDEDAPLPVALLFPGQGSQYVKMLEGVKDLPAVQDMLERAKPILGYDLLELCLQGPEEKLEETRYCQPALFVGGLAGIEKLRRENAEHVTRASVMAGLSLGEYTALCAAGVMTFEDGLKLVKLRGEAMQEAAAIGKQKMASIVGLEKEKVEALCQDAIKAEGKGAVCQVANLLFPNGFAVAGTEKAINVLKDLADKAGAIKASILKTSGAFHTPMMQPAQDKLAAALEGALPSMATPKHTVWMNASAEPMRPGCDPREIVDQLKKQLTNPVLWEPSMRAILEEGITEFYELGPKTQIKAMMKRIDATAWKATKSVEV